MIHQLIQLGLTLEKAGIMITRCSILTASSIFGVFFFIILLYPQAKKVAHRSGDESNQHTKFPRPNKNMIVIIPSQSREMTFEYFHAKIMQKLKTFLHDHLIAKNESRI